MVDTLLRLVGGWYGRYTGQHTASSNHSVNYYTPVMHGHISTSGTKSNVGIVFSDPNFL